MSVTALVVNYRTGALVASLVPHLVQDPSVREIIVVDNSSNDPTDPKTFVGPHLRYVPLPTNMGFAAAVNEGIRRAAHRHVAVINPDVRPEASCVWRLYETACTLNAPLVGPRFYWDPDKRFRLPPATGACLWWDCAVRFARHHPLDAQILQWYWIMRHDRFWSEKAPFPEPFLSGALMMVDRAALASLDGAVFDERFFLYYEDSDLSLRALQAAHAPLCDPRAEAVHFWNQSPEPETPKAALMAAAHRAFYAKHYRADPPGSTVDAIMRAKDPANLPYGKGPDADTSVDSPWSALRRPGQPPVFRWEQTTVPPTFSCPVAENVPRPLYLEFAVSPLFIPFAQADFPGDTFTFPESIWVNLAPGTYFCRLRSPQFGTLAVWEWTKK